MIRSAIWPFAGRDTDAPIRTARLVLRRLTGADIPRIAELAGDWAIASMTARIPYPYTLADARQWIDGLDPNEQVWAIDHQGSLVGVTGHAATPDGTSTEIGYWIGRPYWGQGFATEAARMLVSHCFRHGRFAEVTCAHFADNQASARVIEKLGFTVVGDGRAWCEARRREVDIVRYSRRRPSGWLRLPAA